MLNGYPPEYAYILEGLIFCMKSHMIRLNIFIVEQDMSATFVFELFQSFCQSYIV